MADIIKTLDQISTPPADAQAFNVWLELTDAMGFLKESLQEDEFIVYAALPHSFIHALLVPASLVSPPDIPDLMAWNSNASSSWGISYVSSEPASVSIAPPLGGTGSATLDKGEQLIFARYFEGRLDSNNYFEILQKFTHIFDLHFIAERSAYCQIDKLGDLEDIIRIVTLPVGSHNSGGTVITFKRKVLDEYAALTDSVIVRTFDFTRWRISHFSGWSGRTPENNFNDEYLFYRSVIEPGYASYIRGCQVVHPLVSKEMIGKRFQGIREERKEYASFIAYDWKNGVVREISCAPGQTANYFTESELPFEISPAFFRPEVLSKYKADSEKYQLRDRSISCRGAWHLKTYDVNEAGQVHTYLVYLRDLPYEEQLHWKAHNEKPKGPISKRAFKSDFEGSWDLEYDALNSLREIVRELNEKQIAWWVPRAERLIDLVHYPVTSSADEWSSEILALDQLIVEGFKAKWLRHKAQSLGRTPGPELGSLKLVEECLMGLGFEEDRAREIIAPFRELHDLRSKLKAHASGGEVVSIKRRVLAEYGTYTTHFKDLCARCDDSIKAIVEALI